MFYIWLDHTRPVLGQTPKQYKCAALLLHPFVQMPDGFEGNASLQEQMQYGKPITWHQVMELCDFQTFDEILLALLTQSLAIGVPYARLDLAQKLNSALPNNILLPTDDRISPFLWYPFLALIHRKDWNQLYWSSPIQKRSTTIPLDFVTTEFFHNLPNGECLLADSELRFVCMSRLDAYVTVFLSQDDEIEQLLQALPVEAIICDDATMLWFAFSHMDA